MQRVEEPGPKSLSKEKILVDEHRHHLNKPSLKNPPSKENLQYDLPDVPRGFTFRKKVYPSGSERGLNVNPLSSKIDEIKKLEKQLAEAKLDEDFECCVELKRKLTELKTTN